MGQLRSRRGEHGPSRFRRSRHEGKRRPAARFTPVGQRFPAFGVPRSAAPSRQESGPLSRQPERNRRRESPKGTGPTTRTSRTRDRAHERSRDRIAHRAVRACLPHAGFHPRGVGSHVRAGTRFRILRKGRSQARNLRCELSSRPSTCRARRALHPALPSGVGPARRTPRRSSRTMPRDGPSIRCARRRPQAARTSRRHTRHLGRRVWTHELLPREAHREQFRARSPPPLLLDLARRRRREAGIGGGKPTSLDTTSRRTECTCTTFTRRCSTSSESTTSV